MNETNHYQREYDTGESTETVIPDKEKTAIVEGGMDDSLYGRNKPRREIIRVKVVHDKS
jgi:hypothetical protein